MKRTIAPKQVTARLLSAAAAVLLPFAFPRTAFGVNPDHVLQLLRTNECMGCDLIGADLRGANLPGANLLGADLRGANLTESNLTGADLRGAILRWADFSGANLSEARFVRPLPTTIRRDRITSVNPPLVISQLTAADLRDAIMNGTNLHKA
ncbi:MAG TPA: pentapeptide repeat-containing protein, partial [Vampirovibrionales bacterium]